MANAFIILKASKYYLNKVPPIMPYDLWCVFNNKIYCNQFVIFSFPEIL